MKKRNKIIIYVLVCMLVACAVIGGMWGGIREWQDSKHYVGTTEVPLGIALELQNIKYINGEGEVKITDTVCPSGYVVIEYDFYSTNRYEYLTIIEGRCDGQLCLIGEMMSLILLFGSCFCCVIIGGVFAEIDIARKNRGK
jgi:hypothetical protein